MGLHRSCGGVNLPRKKNRTERREEILSVIYDEYKTLDIKKAEKEEFIVDGSMKDATVSWLPSEIDFCGYWMGGRRVYDAYYGGAADTLKLKLGMTFRSSRMETIWGDMGYQCKVYVYQE